MVYSGAPTMKRTDFDLAAAGSRECADAALPAPARATSQFRDADDDFFCLRFGVWYPSLDCAIRTRYQTCPSCANCDQGRFNLRRHGIALARVDRSSLGRLLRG